MSDRCDYESKVPSQLLCTLCKNIILKCSVTPCKCKYCRHCIKKLLEDGDTFCIGNTDRCGQNPLNLKLHIKEDQETDIEICKLTIRCPYPLCSCSGTISDISTHCVSYHDCNGHSFDWGCELGEGYENNFEKLTVDNKCEIEMIKSSVNDFVNDEILDFKDVHGETRSIEENIESLRNTTALFEKEIAVLTESKGQINSEIDRLMVVKLELKAIFQKASKDIKEFKTLFLPQIDSIKQNLDISNEEIGNLISNKIYVKDISDFSSTFEKVTKRVDNINTRIKEFNEKVEVLNEKVHERESQSTSVAPEDCVSTYLWHVKKFTTYNEGASKRKNGKLTSEDFHSTDKSYKIHFDFYPAGYAEGQGEYTAVFAVVKEANKTKWDGALSYDISASILYDDRRLHTKKLMRIGKADVDHSVGVVKMIRISEIIGQPSLLDNDTLTLEFTVRRK